MEKNKIKNRPVIIGGAIGNCVHVAGVYDFLRIAESMQYETIFLGAAVPAKRFIQEIKKHNADIVCISYRLTADSLSGILEDFFNQVKINKLSKLLFYFGGTPSAIDIARKYPLFTEFFKGEENIHNTIDLLSQNIEGNKKISKDSQIKNSGSKILDEVKINDTDNFVPMIRHHFGLPDLQATINGIKKIAESELTDIISIATDQNAQEFFFTPNKMDKSLDGSGGVPVRTESDLKKLYNASQTGNFPKLRIYSGTENLLQWAEMSERTIKNAWGTVPLFWYSELDGRSKRSLEKAISENQKVIKWYADRNIPVEINDSHHWSLRESSDVTAVVDFYISALNAKKLGVKKYIAQMMFNTPRLTSSKMDLAKMLAKLELIDELKDDNFEYLKQVRAGLTHFSTDMNIAKGQLAASTMLALALKPHIIHVVSFTEAHHAATPEDVIESCGIVKGVLKNTWKGLPDMTIDPDINERKNHLVKEARNMIKKIELSYSNLSDSPLTDPKCLSKIVKDGFLDAPQLRGNPAALGKVKTMPVNGGYEIIDNYGKVISHSDYFNKYLK